MKTNTVDPDEIQGFSQNAARWWDEDGPFRPLHALNPVRLSYLKKQICEHWDLDDSGFSPLEGIKILDIGCGGGLVCEPLARLAADVTGIDADPEAINAAKSHADMSGLTIDYRNMAAEDLEAETYDVVLALEIAEHVPDPSAFIDQCSRLLKPGGLMIVSTLNRSIRSFALGIVAAEYVLRWVPRGTHDWKKFIKPHEMSRCFRQSNIKCTDITGLVYTPLSGFALSKTDLAVNYFMSGYKT